MDGVTIVGHPLVQHKLTLLRKKDISTKSFRELLKEIGVLLCYEVTRDLPLSDVDIETPLAHMKSPQIAGKKLVFAPVLRAGVTFADGMLDLGLEGRVIRTLARGHQLRGRPVADEVRADLLRWD